MIDLEFPIKYSYVSIVSIVSYHFSVFFIISRSSFSFLVLLYHLSVLFFNNKKIFCYLKYFCYICIIINKI